MAKELFRINDVIAVGRLNLSSDEIMKTITDGLHTNQFFIFMLVLCISSTGDGT
jgi:hypothetical protein